MVELLRYRHLLFMLTWRDIRVRYRQSLLGILWAVLPPLAMIAVFSHLFGGGATLSRGGATAPYPIYAFTALVPWTFFSAGLTGAVNSLSANRNLVTKVYFPREVLPLSSISSAAFDFLIAIGVLAGLGFSYHYSGQWTFNPTIRLLWLPALITVQLALTIGLGLLLAMCNLFYRDVRHGLTVVLQLLLFLSDVVVPLPRGTSGWASVLEWNPLVGLMRGYRACILSGEASPTDGFVGCAFIAAIVLAVGWVSFRRAAGRFAEYI